jgi:hypothetical protein
MKMTTVKGKRICGWEGWSWVDLVPFMYAGRLHVWDERHPLGARMRGRDGAVNVARHIASITLGRWLTDQEVVVFKDGNALNLSPANIQVVSRAEMARAINYDPDRPTATCVVCGGEIEDVPSHMDRRETCSIPCRARLSQRFDVAPAELGELVWAMPATSIGALFGVSDKAVAKRCAKLGVERPPAGYWTLLKHGWTHDDALNRLRKRK